MLGHASITITAGTYGRMTPDSMLQAVNVLDGILGWPRNGDSAPVMTPC